MTFEEALKDNESLVFGFVSAQIRDNKMLMKMIDKDDLEQLALISFWKAWKNHDRRKGQINTLFYTIANNEIRQVVRKDKQEKEKRSLTVYLDKHVNEDVENPISSIIYSRSDDVPEELIQVIKRALRSFTPTERIIILMSIDGHSLQEIAEATGTKYNTLKRKQRSEVMGRFRKIIKKNYLDY